jgi:hypothetical protein
LIFRVYRISLIFSRRIAVLPGREQHDVFRQGEGQQSERTRQTFAGSKEGSKLQETFFNKIKIKLLSDFKSVIIDYVNYPTKKHFH